MRVIDLEKVRGEMGDWSDLYGLEIETYQEIERDRPETTESTGMPGWYEVDHRFGPFTIPGHLFKEVGE